MRMSRKAFPWVLGALLVSGLAALEHHFEFLDSAALLLQSAPGSQVTTPTLALPLKDKSVRFGIIGDNGTGEVAQYQVADVMASMRAKFPFEFVLMLGDNIYGSKSDAAFKRKFETPYKALLDSGVKFYASLGNHDDPNEIYYKPFNMGGKRYYNFKVANAEFFALDSTYMDPTQLQWIESKLQASTAMWKICYFHHPLYSDGKFHGPDVDLRAKLEPLLIKNQVRAVFNGHEHVYERIKAQNDIAYFVLGNSGQLRRNNLKPTAIMAKGFDTDQAFMIAEISENELSFQTISRAGQTVDSGVLTIAIK